MKGIGGAGMGLDPNLAGGWSLAQPLCLSSQRSVLREAWNLRTDADRVAARPATYVRVAATITSAHDASVVGSASCAGVRASAVATSAVNDTAPAMAERRRIELPDEGAGAGMMSGSGVMVVLMSLVSAGPQWGRRRVLGGVG
jgi:hypothetical protein